MRFPTILFSPDPQCILNRQVKNMGNLDQGFKVRSFCMVVGKGFTVRNKPVDSLHDFRLDSIFVSSWGEINKIQSTIYETFILFFIRDTGGTLGTGGTASSLLGDNQQATQPDNNKRGA